MNITLFGGSFNPSHLGHVIVISQASELIPAASRRNLGEGGKIDELWLLPDYQHSFAKDTNLAPVKHRLVMTRMLENHKVRTETCAIDQKMSGNTIEHITFLKKKHPRHTFSFLMGSDNLKTFTKWPSWEKLLEIMPFYIYPRAGVPMKPLRPNMHPLTHPLQVVTNISSTMVRRRRKQNLPISHLVPPKVANYLSTHNLY